MRAARPRSSSRSAVRATIAIGTGEDGAVRLCGHFCLEAAAKEVSTEEEEGLGVLPAVDVSAPANAKDPSSPRTRTRAQLGALGMIANRYHDVVNNVRRPGAACVFLVCSRPARHQGPNHELAEVSCNCYTIGSIGTIWHVGEAAPEPPLARSDRRLHGKLLRNNDGESQGIRMSVHSCMMGAILMIVFNHEQEVTCPSEHAKTVSAR
jgi:hypothetical protein